MLRKTMIALLASVALGLLAPGAASARGGFGGFHGGGFHGGGFAGFHGGGGWHGGGIAAFHGVPNAGVGIRHVGFVGGPHFAPGFRHGFPRRAFIGGALIGAAYAPYGYGYYDDAYPYYADPGGYYDSGYVETGCAIVQQPVPTPYGWQYRNVQICQ